MDEAIYDDLPDDHELAFVALVQYYKAKLDAAVEQSEQGNAIAYFQHRYCNEVIAAARSLSIDYIKDHALPDDERMIWDFYSRFETDVLNLIIQIRINHSRRRKKYSEAKD